ncbi:MAG: N-acetylmuramoyl-L-alanine amidase [Cyclobacteriaceae bacterium]|nr:N-acetylmuramoyl-L-alanine amidase [Cyclobacteriaceae bacterium]
MIYRNIFIVLISTFFLSFADVRAQYVDDNIVVAQEGEGIYEILRRNELEPNVHHSPFILINKEKLKGDTLLLPGSTYLLPEKIFTPIPAKAAPERPKSVINPLFGRNYEKIPIIDNRLEGAVYYLVSGHGGPDPGAMGRYGSYMLSEDEYAYDVTLRLARNLISHGATVYMIIQDNTNGIRDESILKLDRTETTISGQALPLNQKDRLQQRVDEVNKLFYKHQGAYQRLIAIHVDSRSQGQNIDVFFYHHDNSESGRKLAQEIHAVFSSKYDRHQPGRDYHGTVSSRSGLYMIRNTLPPIVYIELGNIKNYRDQLRFVISDNRQALANWIELGITNDFKKASDR